MEGSGRIRLLLFLFGLFLLVLALLYVASFMQTKQQSSNTTPRFNNPFVPQADNPFATESGSQNPFETTKSGEGTYKNPFENLR